MGQVPSATRALAAPTGCSASDRPRCRATGDAAPFWRGRNDPRGSEPSTREGGEPDRRHAGGAPRRPRAGRAGAPAVERERARADRRAGAGACLTDPRLEINDASAIDDVIGRSSPWLSNTAPQKKSLYSHVNSSVARAASAGRVRGRITWKNWRGTLAPSTTAASLISLGIVFM